MIHRHPICSRLEYYADLDQAYIMSLSVLLYMYLLFFHTQRCPTKAVKRVNQASRLRNRKVVPTLQGVFFVTALKYNE